ncbi:MAG: SAM-dependent methyltransferase [SAR86 cluster bacterium]|uniref:SAM-dependent methyltransferase n=1 Tax=SAR86 cluster bacterium TaxID=2030880 RepID=A0A2A4MUN3_9GAMM|nr:MAG: SAM-dependent methyltransferase [SAR86 cluster bacterium]
MDKLQITVNTFDKYAQQYQDKYMAHGPYVETYALLSGLLGEHDRVLDVGCGPGNICKYLLTEKPGLQIEGIDLSRQMIDLARANNPTAVFEIADSRNILSLGKTYDAIVAGFCIPYLAKQEVQQLIVDARAMLSDAGVFYLSMMEDSYEKSRYLVKSQAKNEVDKVYTYYYEEAFLVAQLESAGFEILNLERKTFKADGDAVAAVDLFIYARVA